MEELIMFISNEFPDGVQAFDCESFVGDERYVIYEKDNVTVKWCPYYQYIEILGLSKEEFERVIKETKCYH